MKLRHAAVVAGLALGLMSGTAHAALVDPVYNLDFTFGNPMLHLTGLIETDGTLGQLERNNILSYSFNVGGYKFDNTSSNLHIDNNNSADGGLKATTTNLVYKFAFNSGEVQFDGGASLIFGLVNPATSIGFVGLSDPQAFNFSIYFSSEDPTQTITVGTLSTVPLPASAPMFGAALLGLAGLGYVAKRKKEGIAVA